MARLAHSVLLALALVLAAGCGGSDPEKPPIAKGCTLNSDCSGALVCSFGLCHEQCEDTDDCPAGQRCISTGEEESNVCQLPQETGCNFNSDCEEPLVCAIDRQCRNECAADRDCLDGQVCAKSKVCAEEDEVDSNGELKGKVEDLCAGAEDGMTCGGDEVCSGGECVSCVAGASCSPDSDNPCLAGAVSCAQGPSCETAEPLVDGETCGRDQVCSGGECVECKAGAACLPDPENACVVGTLDCSAGPVCDTRGTLDDGEACGSDQVCSGGTCVACVQDEACEVEPGNPCLTGAMNCAAGPACEETGDVADGTSCGAEQVCSAGECVACVEDAACDPGVACKSGQQSCINGPVCEVDGNLEAGTSCGTDKVCDAGGICAACVQDAECEPADDCHVGKQDCTNGPQCVDQETPVADGKACDGGGAGYYFCTAGACGPCQNGGSCTPANVCKRGSWACFTAPPTCNATGDNQPDGTVCGDNQSCISGTCVDNDRVLTVQSGNNQSATIDAALAATVNIKLVDADGVAVPSTLVSVTASEGAHAVGATTDAAGVAKLAVRVGRAVGAYTFTATAPGASSVQFTANATAPTAKHIFTLINTTRTSAAATAPGPGTISKLYYTVYALAAHSNGTLYVGDYCAVYALTPKGELRRVAGTGSTECADTGDGGPAVDAKLYAVNGLALDEGANYLYVSDTYRVRLIDLNTGTISHFAGTGANQAPYGDGGPAQSAYVRASAISVAENGDVYLSDYATSRIRKVDFNSGIISSYRKYESSCPADQVVFYDCGGIGDGCKLAWDAEGRTFFSAALCGGGLQAGTRGIVRVEQDGSLSLVAGDDATSGTQSEGVVATSAHFQNTPQIAFDKAGHLYLSIYGGHKVRRIDSSTHKITTVAGDGTATYAGDYVAATGAKLNYPATIAFDAADNLYIADDNNYAVRGIWKLGESSVTKPKLAYVSGNNQSVAVDAAFGAAIVKVTDGSDVAISGARVLWERLDPGMGLFGTSPFVRHVSTAAANGNAVETGRVGLALGAYDFQASFLDIHGEHASGSPVAFTANAVAPTSGHIYTIVNTGHTSGFSAIPGPATFSQVTYALAGVAASDGTLYLSEYCRVFKLTAQGEISVVAGTGSCAFGGDGGLATDARLYVPVGLAVDETNDLLYIADSGNGRVRVVDLETGIIDTFAGGSASNVAPYGDNGVATSANLSNPRSVSIGPDGAVYITDPGHSRVRKVANSVITTWIQDDTTNCSTTPLKIYNIMPDTEVIWLVGGAAYISAQLCGTETANQSVNGVVHRAANGTLTRVAGINSAAGVQTEGAQATNTYFPYFSGMAYDPAGNFLAISQDSSHKVRRINLANGQITTVAGTGTAGTGTDADYVPGTTSALYNPQRIFYTPAGRLTIADYNNFAFRQVW